MRERERRNVRLQPILLLLVALAVVLTGILLYTGYETQVSFDRMDRLSGVYTTCEKSAQSMQNASDYLTKQAQTFAVTGDISYMDRYFEEVNVSQNRDKALETIGLYFDGTDAYQDLETALAQSNSLMVRELYAMRLMSEYKGYALAALPEEIRQVTLAPEDQTLTGEEKKDLAREMVFGQEYQNTKDTISTAVSDSVEDMRASLRNDQVESSRQLVRFLHLSYLLVGALLVIVFGTFLLTTALALRPLRQAIRRIQDKDLIPETGAYEVQYLARTYNHMFEKNRLHQDKLSYEATHDPLTGLFNRGVFEEMMSGSPLEQYALILVDLDHFKQMNDNHGHQVGDQVLKRLASVLQDCFRSEDYVCRIGGDEFAVLMVHVDASMRPLVDRKLSQIRERIAAVQDLPPFTLSMGAAFSGEGISGTDLYNHADNALYRVKERGRNGYDFYGD